MKNLFVDVDSTLVLWTVEQTSFGIYLHTDHWNPNTPLIEAVKNFQK